MIGKEATDDDELGLVINTRDRRITLCFINAISWSNLCEKGIVKIESREKSKINIRCGTLKSSDRLLIFNVKPVVDATISKAYNRDEDEREGRGWL